MSRSYPLRSPERPHHQPSKTPSLGPSNQRSSTPGTAPPYGGPSCTIKKVRETGSTTSSFAGTTVVSASRRWTWGTDGSDGGSTSSTAGSCTYRTAGVDTGVGVHSTVHGCAPDRATLLSTGVRPWIKVDGRLVRHRFRVSQTRALLNGRPSNRVFTRLGTPRFPSTLYPGYVRWHTKVPPHLKRVRQIGIVLCYIELQMVVLWTFL